jgi:RNA polymerase sigma-70 factor (ECF subfamily)
MSGQRDRDARESTDPLPGEVIQESDAKPLSLSRETWDPGLGGPETRTGVDQPANGEPDPHDRVLSSDMTSLGYEMVERGPLAPSVSEPGPQAMRDPVRVIDDPDRELVRRWHAGDESAFEQLVRLHEKKVYRLLLRMMGNREEAEDVAQETFLSLHRHGHRFRGEARFSTFVYRVASNAALNRRRTLGRNRARLKKLAVRQAAGDDLPQTPRDPEDSAGGIELSGVVREALDSLKPTLRMPVLLYDIEGLAYGEIAEVLGVAEGTVKSRIHRARQALRLKLAKVVRESHEGPDAGPRSSSEGADQ